MVIAFVANMMFFGRSQTLETPIWRNVNRLIEMNFQLELINLGKFIGVLQGNCSESVGTLSKTNYTLSVVEDIAYAISLRGWNRILRHCYERTKFNVSAHNSVHEWTRQMSYRFITNLDTMFNRGVRSHVRQVRYRLVDNAQKTFYFSRSVFRGKKPAESESCSRQVESWVSKGLNSRWWPK